MANSSPLNLPIYCAWLSRNVEQRAWSLSSTLPDGEIGRGARLVSGLVTACTFHRETMRKVDWQEWRLEYRFCGILSHNQLSETAARWQQLWTAIQKESRAGVDVRAQAGNPMIDHTA